MTASALVAPYRRAIGVVALLTLALGAWKAVARTAMDREARSPLPVGTTLPVGVWSLIQDPTGPTQPAVVMYISESCPHCALEVARWDSLERIGVLPHALRRMLVVAPAVTQRRHLARFPDVTALDTSHRLAALLRIRVVPTTYWVDATGSIRRVTRGEQLPTAIMSQVRSLVGGDE